MPKKLVFLSVAFLLSATPVTLASYAQIGDVIISRSVDSWKCDQLECPIETTFSCTVIKRNSPENLQTLVRENFCYSESNEVLKTISSNSTITGNQNILVNIQMNKYGIVSSSSIGQANGVIINSGIGGSGVQIGNFDAAAFAESMREFQKGLSDGISNMMRNIFG